MILAAICAMVLDLYHLGAAPLWFDEVLTTEWLRADWWAMVRAVLADNHVPLYPLALKAWSAAFGASSFALRLPGVPCHGATVLCIGALAGLAGGPRAARVAAIVAAVNPFLLHHAQEARMYSLLGALASGSLLITIRFLMGRTRSLGVGFVLVNAALLATHYYAMFAIGAEILAVLWLRPAAWRRYVPALVVTSGLCLLAAASALLLARHDAGGAYRLGFLAFPGMGWTLVGGYTLLPDSATLHSQGWRSSMPYLVVAVPAAVATIALGVAAARTVDRRLLIPCALVAAATLGGPYAITLAMPAIGLNPRYTTAAAPALIAIGALGFAAVPRSRATLIAGLFLLAVMIAGTARELANPGSTREDISAAQQWLDANVPAEEPILVMSSEMWQLARYHWPARALVEYPRGKVVADGTNAGSLAHALPLRDTRGRWIFIVGRAWQTDPGGEFQRELARQYGTCPGIDLRGIRILCLTPR